MSTNLEQALATLANMGIGAVYGLAIAVVIGALMALAATMPSHVPVLTPIWIRIRELVARPIVNFIWRIDHKLNREDHQ